MQILQIMENKKQYLDLLLLADEQESQIDRYLERGDMFVLLDSGVKAECVVTREGDGVCEIKNIATAPASQKMGYGKKLILFLFSHYADCATFFVGTGESPLTIPFYEHCGFRRSHRVKNFFLNHYDHPIFEQGVRLIDMIYLCWDRPKRE